MWTLNFYKYMYLHYNLSYLNETNEIRINRK
jgi:hypothetical protein